MSGKIEISRELAERIATGNIEQQEDAIEDLRALLSAPVVDRQEPDVVALPRKYLISYRTPSGFGRFFNDRQDGTVPSEENIVSMETKLESQHGVQCTILQVTEISPASTRSRS